MIKSWINFNNISNDAIELFSNAYHKIVLLATSEKYDDFIPDQVYMDVEQYCSNVIFSCIQDDIYDFDEIQFLRNIGIIYGDLKLAKKSHIRKVYNFQTDLRSFITTNSIDRLLLILDCLEKYESIIMIQEIGEVKRKHENYIKNRNYQDISKKMRETPIEYTINNNRRDDFTLEEIRRFGYKGSIDNPFLGGGWSPR